MTEPPRIRVAGTASLGVQPEIAGPLDELIYKATSGAIADAGLTIADIDGVCMAASDVLDGRGISTMTLTGSMGSLKKSELRVCDDSLAAVRVAAAEIMSGASDIVLVAAWSKLSDADTDAIAPLSLEPAYHRPLGLRPATIQALRESSTLGRPILTTASDQWPADTAVAMVLGRGNGQPSSPVLTGFGASMGRYLVPDGDLGAPLRDATERACRMASVERRDLRGAYLVGLSSFDDRRLAESLGIPEQAIEHVEPREADIGYAAGLHALRTAVQEQRRGPVLVVSVGGVGMQSANAVVVEAE